jgi:hypothetical protein
MAAHAPLQCSVHTLDLWLNHGWSCVKWFDAFSDFFKINFGVRQGSVLSPFLCAIYLDDLSLRSNDVQAIILLFYTPTTSYCSRDH